MRNRRNAPLPDDICLCVPEIGFRCVWCERGQTKIEPLSFQSPTTISAESPPWDIHELPPHLQGYGHRGADQDGYDGSEWISPQQDLEQQMIEAARVLLDAEQV